MKQWTACRLQETQEKKTDAGGKQEKPKRSVRECALSLLEHRDRTELELRRKLKEREYAPAEIDQALEFLKKYGYIDDEAYARRYIRAGSAGKSIRRMRQELQLKGISREVLDLCFEEAEVDEEGLIRACLRKKGFHADAEDREHMDPAVYRKLAASLARKGFSFEKIRRVMGSLDEEIL
ncbi:MAG: regulatory protein RecX [Eubacteriales bacterium]|nr:regulatory protein RecX [Eubacteriales bacterium]